MTGDPACPFCGAGAAERVGLWSGQIITSQWRCGACGSYFEALRADFDGPAPGADAAQAARRPGGAPVAPSSERK